MLTWPVSIRLVEEGLVDWYPWVVLTHVLAAFGFVLSHGVSAYAAFAIRRERDPQRIGALLDLSGLGIGGMYAGLGILLIAGIAAAIMGNWFGQIWPWASIGLLVLIAVAMFAMGTRYYATVREAVGKSKAEPSGEPPAPMSPEELGALLDNRRPEALALIGLVGLGLIIWLMELKPF